MPNLKAVVLASLFLFLGCALVRSDNITSLPILHKPKLVAAEDLPNFHVVHPFLFRGGEPTTAGLEKLKKQGVQTIIDLRGNIRQTKAEATMAQVLGLRYINFPMSAQPPTKEQVAVLLKTIREARDGITKGPVFVHCAHGSDRTGCMIGIWRTVEDAWPYDKCYREMRKYYFNPKFTKLADTVRSYASKSAQ